VVGLAGRIHGVGDAIGAAADLVSIADEESSAAATERDAAEKTKLMEVLGVDPAARTQPPHIRSQLAALEREQKARATRHSRDVLDRSLVDLLSIYRDALVLHSGASLGLVNQDNLPAVQALARSMRPEQLLSAMDAIGTARERIGLNVAPLLALEAMAISLRVPH
jgi:DNA polymerase-3 subunit delta'